MVCSVLHEGVFQVRALGNFVTISVWLSRSNSKNCTKGTLLISYMIRVVELDYKSRAIRSIGYLVLLTMVVSSCASNVSTDGTTTTTTTTESTTTTTSTLVLSTDPQEALNQVAKIDQAVDQSRISKSDCGVYSATVGPKGLRLYRWEDQTWIDQTSSLPTTFDAPYLITTRDYTYDNVLDFLINFDEKGIGSIGSMHGAILSLLNCRWEWTSFQSVYKQVGVTFRNLTWSDATVELTGTDFMDGAEVSVWLSYSRDSRVFESNPMDGGSSGAAFVDVPVAPLCAKALRSLYLNTQYWRGYEDLKGRAYFEVTENLVWGIKELIGSLSECRNYDWIKGVTERTSQFSTASDYVYYRDSASILLGDDAARNLKRACGRTWVVTSGFYEGDVYKASDLQACW